MGTYVDDMVIKSMDEQDMLEDILETFEILRKINMRLNPKKCSFGMEEGQFLGHVVFKIQIGRNMETFVDDMGIKANPTKIQALTSLKRPKAIKEVQSLNATNNEVEYEVVIAGLRIAKEMKIEEITMFLENKSIYEKQVAKVVTEEEGRWMSPIIEYLGSGILPADKKLARKIRVKAPIYQIIGEILYKRYFLTPWLRCVGLNQERSVIKEIHGGSYGLHAGPRSIMAKITTLGYYWPSMHRDSVEIIQNCDACQIHSSISRLPKQDMTSVTTAWPFIQRGIDIVGPSSEALGKSGGLLPQSGFEAKPASQSTYGRGDKGTEEDLCVEHIVCLFGRHIVCRFGIPQMIVSDNGKQFEEGHSYSFV
ncbi:reverse transcriptase domain-containing protein [Tanacetum coccineum]